MASSDSTQDVVNNPQSAASQPVDASGHNVTSAAPSGTNETTSEFTTSQIKDSVEPQSTIPNHTQPSQGEVISDGQQAESQTQDNDNHETGQSNEAQDNETFEVGSYKSADVEGSLGSDAELSKIDGAGKDAIPRYTLKKPAGFKPVSVTKSFLAKAGTIAPPLKAIVSGEKASTPSSPAPGSATSTTRPRLVAKTLSSSKNTPKALNTSFKRSGVDGPDPNQVWNRNRVQMAPQATPKHMTDEELKNRYGIELASRPLESTDPNQTKWADLEDEDEDWAVGDLQWSDGFKPTGNAKEPSAPEATLKEVVNQENQTKEKPAPAAKMSLGPKATVLKLGSGATQPNPVSTTPGATLANKGPGDKPTLVAKPSPAPPAKSPWAQLPPVEKVSPIVPPVQVPASRFAHSAGYGRDSGPASQPQPTREIAADDYSRFPLNGAPQQLFNSQSGRYEPAPQDARRMSIKKEGGFRAAGVLQRPGPGEPYIPAEPSPAFQTNRTSGDAWRRRRASSNVSGDSGPFARRMSMNRPGPEGFGRRDSTHDSAIASGYGPSIDEHRRGSPAISHGPSATSQQSPIMEHARVIDQHGQFPGTPGLPQNIGDDVARQKIVMKEQREKAEAAVKRRKEEEEREEAERKERLRKKLESLKPKPAEAIIAPRTPAAEVSTPTTQAQEVAKTASPPKPPVPSNESQRYGMMTVHGVNQSGANVGVDGKTSQALPQDDLSAKVDQHNAPYGRPQRAVPDNKPQHLAQAMPATQSSQQAQQPNSQGSVPRPGNVWDRSATTVLPSHSNVWGPPGSQKALGNGDFQQSVTQIHLPPVSAQQYPQHLSTPQPQAQPQPIGTPRQSIQQQGLQRGNPDQHAMQPGYPRGHAQQPIAPANAAMNQPNRPPGLSAWSDFAKNAPVYDAKRKAEMAQATALAGAERERSGLSQQAPVLHETWTQVAKGDELGVRKAVNSSSTTHRDYNAVDIAQHAAQAPHTRSRYQDLFEHNERFMPDFHRPQQPLTPPPEEGDHPVYFGGAMRPKVRLPGSVVVDKPAPIVRLPDARAYHMHPSIRALQQQQQPMRYQASHRGTPVVNTGAWQQRFNGLLNTQHPQPQRAPVDAVGFSTSKEPLEHERHRRTPVSLPPQENLPEEPTTKNIEDEIELWEEARELGSLPSVHLPTQAPRLARYPAKPYMDTRKIKAAILTDDMIRGRHMFDPHSLPNSGPVFIWVRLPKIQSSKRFELPRPHLNRPNRPSASGRGGKSRNSSGQHNASKVKEGPSPTQSPGTNAPRTPGAAPSGHTPTSRKTSGHGRSWHSSQHRQAPAPAAAVH